MMVDNVEPSGRSSKIALFLPSLEGGGAERVMVTLANGFAAKGQAVEVVLCQGRGVYLTDLHPAVRVVNLNTRRVLTALLPLSAYLRRERPAALLSAMNHANVVALLAQKLSGSGTRVVVSEHNTISVESQRVTGWGAKCVYALVKLLYPKAAAVVAVSRKAAEDLQHFAGLPPQQITAIYNPFDIAAIGRQSQETLEHPWFAAGQPPVVLAIGRLTEAKAFPTLITAFAKLRQRCPARLLVLGEGPARQELEVLASNLGLTEQDIQMPGFVSNPFRYLARAGVFALSSRWEGLPSVLIEAMACGTAIVSTDCPSGPDEILESGRWGRLVPVGDTDALANALEVVLTMLPEERPSVRHRAQDFDMHHAVDAYLQLLVPPRPAHGKD